MWEQLFEKKMKELHAQCAEALKLQASRTSVAPSQAHIVADVADDGNGEGEDANMETESNTLMSISAKDEFQNTAQSLGSELEFSPQASAAKRQESDEEADELA
jgi:hypothetical protein